MRDLVRRTSNYTYHELQAGLEDLPLRQIAQELAQRINSKQEILEKYGISSQLWDVIRAKPTFRQMVMDAVAEWDSPKSSEERIRLKAKKALEDSLIVLYEIAHDRDNVAPPARLQAVERMAKIAGVETPREGVAGGGGSGFAININIAGGVGDGAGQTITVEGQVAGQMDRDDGSDDPIRGPLEMAALGDGEDGEWDGEEWDGEEWADGEWDGDGDDH